MKRIFWVMDSAAGPSTGEKRCALVPDEAVSLSIGARCPTCNDGRIVEAISRRARTFRCGRVGEAATPAADHPYPELTYHIEHNGTVSFFVHEQADAKIVPLGASVPQTEPA